MHWIYVLQCEDNVTYVGETKRLFTRLKEHCKKHTGSVTTHCVNPEKIIGLYRLETATKKKALELENSVTEMIMQNKGKYFYKVFGGKYHVGFRPDINPVKDKEFSRPLCNCKMPADIKEFNDKKYWRCSKKNIWNKLESYVTDKLDFKLQNTCEPCNFYKNV